MELSLEDKKLLNLFKKMEELLSEENYEPGLLTWQLAYEQLAVEIKHLL